MQAQMQNRTRGKIIAFLYPPTARRFLRDNGEVFTLRLNRMIERPTEFYCRGSDYITRLGTVRFIKELRELRPRRLARYVKKSGFSRSRDWIGAFYELAERAMWKRPDVAYLYHVCLLDRE